MANKITLEFIKTAAKRASIKYGYQLDKTAPYYVNHGAIQAIKAKIGDIIESTHRYSVTAKQQDSLKNWVRDLESKYL